MAQLFAPGVYVQEVSKLGRSVVAQSTSIPAFIGYTEIVPSMPVKIASIQAYEAAFGGPQPFMKVSTGGGVREISDAYFSIRHTMWYSLSLYFMNGGGPCWVVSAGEYLPVPTPGQAQTYLFAGADKFVGGGLESGALAKLDNIEEISLLNVPELPNFTAEADRGKIIKALLADCEAKGNRFAILDEVMRSGVNAIAVFRAQCGNLNLSYGAVYYPQVEWGMSVPATAIKITESDPKLNGLTLAKAMDDAMTNDETARLLLPNIGKMNAIIAKVVRLYLPAGAAVAAIYGKTDATRGVWKAPANVQIMGVKPPLEAAWMGSNTELSDIDNGKDINLIRHILGKGTTVWGARTLAGKDLNWRYVPVKRLMMMLADTLKQATAYAVFEPNTANTWKSAATMCENFLDDLWRKGALLGAKPTDAYRVRIGLGQTMTAEDVLNGIMRIEIAVAPVRPAEFVVLQFSHFVQPN